MFAPLSCRNRDTAATIPERSGQRISRRPVSACVGTRTPYGARGSRVARMRRGVPLLVGEAAYFDTAAPCRTAGGKNRGAHCAQGKDTRRS